MKTKILLLFSALIILASCGTRKATITKYKENVTVEEKTKVKSDSTSSQKETVKEKTEVKSVEQKDVTEKDVKTEVREIFDKDGKLSERTTTTTIIDKTDKSILEGTRKKEKESTSLKETAKRINRTANKVVDSLIKSNSKNIDSNTTIVKNFGGWVPLMLLGFMALVAIWYWLIRR